MDREIKYKAESPHEYYVKRDKWVREYQIAVETMGIVRKDLAHCVRTESVNQFTKCKDLREKYFALCLDNYHGMIFPEGQEPASRQVPGLIAPKIRSNF
eukprot:gene23494-31847_t